jgi:hypothetical protein
VTIPVADSLSVSTSIINRQKPRPERPLRAISRSTAANRKARLKSPVRASMVDSRMAASRDRRCSRATTIATYVSRTNAARLMAIVATAIGSSPASSTGRRTATR